MRILKRRRRGRVIAASCTIGFLCQLNGCQFDEITVTQTVDGRELLVSLIRGAVLGPVDAFITTTINDAFDDEE